MPKPGEIEYENGILIGKLLAENNLNVCSGGFQGIMDAVSKGATEAGAKAIGVTVDAFSAKPSKYLTEQIHCSTLFDRISKLVELGDGYLILPGGTGTFLELAVVWEFLNKGLMGSKPIVCCGLMWKEIVSSINNRMVFENRRIDIVKFIPEAEEAVKYIINSVK